MADGAEAVAAYTAVDTQKSRRNRVKSACRACKASKIKCDGEHPCVNCIRKGKTCTYMMRNGKYSGEGSRSEAEGALATKIGDEELSSINKFRDTVGSLIPCLSDSILHIAVNGKPGNNTAAVHTTVQRACLTAIWAAAAYGAYLEGDNTRGERYLELSITIYRTCFDVITSETVWALVIIALVQDHLGNCEKLRLYTGFADVVYRTNFASDMNDPTMSVCIQFLKTLAYFIEPTVELEPVADHGLEQSRYPPLPLTVLILHKVNCTVRSYSKDSLHQCHILQSMIDQSESNGGFSTNPIGHLTLHALLAHHCVAKQRLPEAIQSLQSFSELLVQAPHLMCNAFTWHLLHGAAHMLRETATETRPVKDILTPKLSCYGHVESIHEVRHPFSANAVDQVRTLVQQQRAASRSAASEDHLQLFSPWCDPLPQPNTSAFPEACEIRTCASTESASSEQPLPESFVDDELWSLFRPKREASHLLSNEDMYRTKRAMMVDNHGVSCKGSAFSYAQQSTGYYHHPCPPNLSQQPAFRTSHHYHQTCPHKPELVTSTSRIMYGNPPVNVIDEHSGLSPAHIPMRVGDIGNQPFENFRFGSMNL